MVDGALGTVGVENLEPVSETDDIVADRFQAVRGLPGQEGGRFQITVDPVPDEIIGAEIADLEDCIGHDVGEGDESAGVRFGCDGSIPFPLTGGEKEGNGKEYKELFTHDSSVFVLQKYTFSEYLIPFLRIFVRTPDHEPHIN